MSTRYYQEDNGWPGSAQVNGSQLKPWALAMMKEWHLADPVSQKEIDRNNAVYEIQGNRNPFIDHPEYVSYIWGGPVGVEDKEFVSNLRVYPVPAVDFCIIEHNGYFSTYDFSIELRDITGREYEVDYSVSGDQIKVNSQKLNPGFYFITIYQDGKKPAFARIVK
jgi:hypothetical protein